MMAKDAVKFRLNPRDRIILWLIVAPIVRLVEVALMKCWACHCWHRGVWKIIHSIRAYINAFHRSLRCGLICHIIAIHFLSLVSPSLIFRPVHARPFLFR